MPLCLLESVTKNRIPKSVAVYVYVLAATVYLYMLHNLRGFW